MLPEGVTWHPGTCLWRADIVIDGKLRYLGCRERIEDASQLYQDRLAKENARARPTTIG